VLSEKEPEEKEEAPITIYPNPASNILHIALHAALRDPVLRLYDMTGRPVYQEDILLGINDIEVSNLPSGLYIWEVSGNGERVKTGKVVVLYDGQ
jgi:Secretion system C-terminal sorting domain